MARTRFLLHTCERERRYRFVGSREGLSGFVQILIEYAQHDYNDAISEHEHYGPYMPLEIIRWHQAGIDGHAIHGTLDDLRRLASLVSDGVARRRFTIFTEYAQDTQWMLYFEVHDDTFDPGFVEAASSQKP